MPAPLLTPLLVALLIASAQAASFGGEIINGKSAAKGSLQYMASVQINREHECGGFLIFPQFVLTAAHCDKGHDRKKMSVVLGTHDVAKTNRNIQRFTVMNKIRHEEYKEVGSGNDIMLLKLSEKVELKNVKTVKIPVKDQTMHPNTRCTVAGWGITENKTESIRDLRVVDVSTVDLDTCRKQWDTENIKLPKNIICAGGYKTKNGACQGDSGGPLVCSGIAVGIVSFNSKKKGCDYPNVPNVYTRISKFLPWIKKHTKNAA